MPRIIRTLALGAALAAAAVSTGRAAADPFALLIAGGTVDSTDRARVDAGTAVFEVLPARGRDLAVVGLTRTHAAPARLAAWTRAAELLYQGRYMPAIGRFSDPPRIGDLARLTLDDQDVDDLRSCRTGDCAVKLSAPEIEQIRAAAVAAGPQWKPAVQAAFREVVLARAQAYLRAGFVGAPPYHDRRHAVSPAEEFTEIAARLGFEALYGTRVVPYLEAFPAIGEEPVESFLYWSKETLGAGKPIVSVTHVAIFRSPHRDAPGTAVAARQVFATHYLTASLSLTLMTGGVEGQPRYLVYLRRSRTDAFEGLFGKVVRGVVERRIRSDAPAVLDAMRRKLEGGEPPIVGGTR